METGVQVKKDTDSKAFSVLVAMATGIKLEMNI